MPKHVIKSQQYYQNMADPSLNCIANLFNENWKLFGLVLRCGRTIDGQEKSFVLIIKCTLEVVRFANFEPVWQSWYLLVSLPQSYNKNIIFHLCVLVTLWYAFRITVHLRAIHLSPVDSQSVSNAEPWLFIGLEVLSNKQSNYPWFDGIVEL